MAWAIVMFLATLLPVVLISFRVRWELMEVDDELDKIEAEFDRRRRPPVKVKYRDTPICARCQATPREGANYCFRCGCKYVTRYPMTSPKYMA